MSLKAVLSPGQANSGPTVSPYRASATVPGALVASAGLAAVN